jgi:hypothetical protein
VLLLVDIAWFAIDATPAAEVVLTCPGGVVIDGGAAAALEAFLLDESLFPISPNFDDALKKQPLLLKGQIKKFK